MIAFRNNTRSNCKVGARAAALALCLTCFNPVALAHNPSAAAGDVPDRGAGLMVEGWHPDHAATALLGALALGAEGPQSMAFGNGERGREAGGTASRSITDPVGKFTFLELIFAACFAVLLFLAGFLFGTAMRPRHSRPRQPQVQSVGTDNRPSSDAGRQKSDATAPSNPFNAPPAFSGGTAESKRQNQDWVAEFPPETGKSERQSRPRAVPRATGPVAFRSKEEALESASQALHYFDAQQLLGQGRFSGLTQEVTQQLYNKTQMERSYWTVQWTDPVGRVFFALGQAFIDFYNSNSVDRSMLKTQLGPMFDVELRQSSEGRVRFELQRLPMLDPKEDHFQKGQIVLHS